MKAALVRSGSYTTIVRTVEHNPDASWLHGRQAESVTGLHTLRC